MCVCGRQFFQAHQIEQLTCNFLLIVLDEAICSAEHSHAKVRTLEDISRAQEVVGLNEARRGSEDGCMSELTEKVGTRRHRENRREGERERDRDGDGETDGETERECVCVCEKE